MSSSIKFLNFSKEYPSGAGVHDISLEIESGEVFGFLGPNGAGKSTTIRAMLNFIYPTSGSITMLGLDSVADHLEIARRVGYLAGDIALYEDMTGSQIVAFIASLGVAPDPDYVQSLVDRLGAQMKVPIKTLSKGNKQKIGLIQAFMNKPDLLILDEPTSGLDPLMKEVFYAMVLEMRSQGKTVFISSHDLTEVQKICDRAAFIKDGKIVSIEDIAGNNQIAIKRFVIGFDKQVTAAQIEAIPGVTQTEIIAGKHEIIMDGDINPLLQFAAKAGVTSLVTKELTLEELFIHYYA